MRSQGARWSISPRIGEEQLILLGADSLLLAQLLWNRGLRSKTEAHDFLHPVEAFALGDQRTLHGVDVATNRLVQAIERGEQIAVYGDYDVDGIAGAALVVKALQGLGARVLTHLPHRSRDGYGVNAEAVRDLAERGVTVMITVDCGITANAEVEIARELGIDVVVTDHHTVPADIPAALAVINPHQPLCSYPNKDLSGGGVALQLARSVLYAMLDRAQAEARLEDLMTFAAMSTIADVVPLTGENRGIVARGIAAARNGSVVGLQALIALSGRPLDQVSAQDFSFSLIPRLNAAGRMGDAEDALQLLLTDDAVEAQDIAARLDIVNSERRGLLDELLSRAGDEASEASDEGAIVLAGDYPIGLAGLVAARMAERHAAPCVVIERSGGTSRGSARSSGGVHLMDALTLCSGSLLQFGGHAYAAGFSLDTKQIESFRRDFTSAVRTQMGGTRSERVIEVDGQIRLASVGLRLVELVESFDPVGAGNPSPKFVSRAVTVESVQSLNGGNLRFRLRQGAEWRDALAFRPEFEPPAPGTAVDILYEVQRNTFNGQERIDMLIRDLRPASPGEGQV